MFKVNKLNAIFARPDELARFAGAKARRARLASAMPRHATCPLYLRKQGRRGRKARRAGIPSRLAGCVMTERKIAGMTKRKKEKTKSRTLEYPVASKVRDLSYLKSVIQNNTFILTSIKLLVKSILLKCLKNFVI